MGSEHNYSWRCNSQCAMGDVAQDTRRVIDRLREPPARMTVRKIHCAAGEISKPNTNRSAATWPTLNSQCAMGHVPHQGACERAEPSAGIGRADPRWGAGE